MSSHRRSTLARTDENLSDDSDLVKVELDRRLAAKDHQRDLELACLGVNLGDLAIKVGKRAIGDADGRTNLNINRRTLGRIALTGTTSHLIVLVAGKRSGLAVAAQETGDAGRVANTRPCIVIHLHANQNITREDLIPFSFGGHKVRIAAEIMKEIRAGGYTYLITYGSSGSNMNRAAAYMSAAAGIKCCAVIKRDKSNHETVCCNEELVRRSGARIVYCTQESVRESVEKALNEAVTEGERPYYIYGDSTGHGSEPVLMRASLNEYKEISAYEEKNGIRFDDIVLAVGTGMTAGGLCAAAAISGGKERITGITVARPAETALRIIRENLSSYYGPECRGENLRITEEHLCGGYGLYDSYTEAVINRVRQDTGICLDPTYTGKAFGGLLKEVRQGRLSGNVLFIHTGGYPVYADWAGIRL